jgi:hypothetical protein
MNWRSVAVKAACGMLLTSPIVTWGLDGSNRWEGGLRRGQVKPSALPLLLDRSESR